LDLSPREEEELKKVNSMCFLLLIVPCFLGYQLYWLEFTQARRNTEVGRRDYKGRLRFGVFWVVFLTCN
jgi:hypothetical protein